MESWNGFYVHWLYQIIPIHSCQEKGWFAVDDTWWHQIGPNVASTVGPYSTWHAAYLCMDSALVFWISKRDFQAQTLLIQTKAQKSSLILRHFKLMVQKFSFVFPKLFDINVPRAYFVDDSTDYTCHKTCSSVLSFFGLTKISSFNDRKNWRLKKCMLAKAATKFWRQKWVGKTKIGW